MKRIIPDGFTRRDYLIWKDMKRRCTDPKTAHYNRYGGKGITYDPRWEDFRVFCEDMGPSNGLTIDRKDSSLGYYKDNCRWLSKEENGRLGAQAKWGTRCSDKLPEIKKLLAERNSQCRVAYLLGMHRDTVRRLVKCG